MNELARIIDVVGVIPKVRYDRSELCVEVVIDFTSLLEFQRIFALCEDSGRAKVGKTKRPIQ